MRLLPTNLPFELAHERVNPYGRPPGIAVHTGTVLPPSEKS